MVSKIKPGIKPRRPRPDLTRGPATEAAFSSVESGFPGVALTPGTFRPRPDFLPSGPGPALFWPVASSREIEVLFDSGQSAFLRLMLV